MSQAKDTIWTAAATTSPVLERLDKNAPPIARPEAEQRAARLKERIRIALIPFQGRIRAGH